MKVRRLLLLLVICSIASAYHPESVPDCSSSSTLITLHPYEGDCGLYYRCEHGYLAVFSCPQYHVFSESAKSCVPCSDDIEGCEERCLGSKSGGGGGGGGGSSGGGGGGGGGGGNCGGGGGGGGGGSNGGGGGGGGGGGSCTTQQPTTTTKQPTTTTKPPTTTTKQPTSTTQQETTTISSTDVTIPLNTTTPELITTERYTTQRVTTERYSTPVPTVGSTPEINTTTTIVSTTPIPTTTESVTSTTEQYVTEETSTEPPKTTEALTTIPEETTTEEETTTQKTTGFTSSTTPEPTTSEQETTTEYNDPCSVPTCGDFDYGIMKPYPFDCTMYIYCSDSGAVLRRCTPGLIFSEYDLRCIELDIAQCKTCPMPTTTEATIEEETTGTTSDSSCSIQETCNSDNLYSMLPYKSDCQKYIYCGDDGEKIRNCPLNEHFSPEIFICMDSELANCPDCSITTETPPECPTQKACTLEDNFLTIPYVSNCRKYIYCENNEEILSYCPFPLHYSPIQNTCMEPELANCLKCTPSDTTTEIPETTTEISTESTETLICPFQQQCTLEDAGYMIPYVNDCRFYIYCDQIGKGTLSMCPLSERFSPSKKFCTDVNESDCQQCIPATPAPTSTTTDFIVATLDPKCSIQRSCTPEDVYQTFPYLLDCHRFIYCKEDGVEDIRVCPGSQHFSPTENFCMEPEEANCPDCSSSSKPNQNGPIHVIPNRCLQKTCTPEILFDFIPFVGDCTRYIYCDGTESGQIRTCPINQHFDRVQEICIDANKANCQVCNN